MTKKSKLTPAEWEIMEAVWNLGRSPSVRDVIEHSFKNGEKAYTTVQTVMNKLVEKKMLSRQKIGLVNFYTPTEGRKSMVKLEVTAIVSRMFRGSATAFANYLIDTEDISLAEIEEIKAMLSEKEQKLKE